MGIIKKKMRFAIVAALVASVSAGTVEELVNGWPLGEYVPRTPTNPTQAGSGGTNTWGCCTYTYDASVQAPVLATNLLLTPPISARSTAPPTLPERSAPPLKILTDSEEFKMTYGHEVGYLVNTIKNKIF